MSQTKHIPLPDNWDTCPIHPLAALTEFGAGVDPEAVVEDMRLHGYDSRESLVFYQGMLFDGRLRRSSAIKAGVKPTACEFVGADPIAFTRRKILRQHLSISQRSMFAEELARLSHGGDRKSAEIKTENSVLNTIAQAAAAVDVSPASVDFARIVKDHGSKALIRAVNTGLLKVSDAAKVARKAKAIQDHAVAEVQAKRAKTATEAATLCKRCEGRIKKGQSATADCVVCRAEREKPPATKGAGKGSRKSAKEKAQPEPAPEFKPAACLGLAATGLYEFIDKTPPTFGWHDHPDQKKLKAAVDDLVADLEAWVRRLAGNEKTQPFFDNTHRAGPKGYGH